MTTNQHNLFEDIPDPVLPLTNYRQLAQIVNEEFAEALMRIIPIYNTSEFLTKMHQLPHRYKEFNQVSMGRISYRDEYLVGYLDKARAKSAHAVYCAGYGLKSPLMAYEFLIFDNKSANSFCVIHHQDIRRYDSLWRSSTIDADVRQELYKNLCTLACQDIWIDAAALAYYPEIRDFKVMNFQEIRVGRLSSPEKIADYQEQYRKLLQIR